jgi:uncharacterized protein (TIGR00730 family)
VNRICVFCGSYSGARSDYAEAARDLADAFVRENIALVYGGGRVGLMGIVADEVIVRGGQAIGVIPRALLRRELGHPNLTAMRVVDTMHERKAMMAELSDGFIALPGGLGTLEEILEIWTWAQLGMHRKPVGFLNVAGYYSGLFEFLDHAVSESFIRPEMRRAAVVESDPDALLHCFAEYVPPAVEQWIDREET